MNNSALKTVLHIIKYLSITVLVIWVVFGSDIPSTLVSGDFKNAFGAFNAFIRNDITLFSVIVLICIAIIAICNIIIRFLKLDDESKELDNVNNDAIYAVNMLENEYKNLNKDVKKLKNNLEIANQQSFEDKHNTLNKLSNQYNKMEIHLERRKTNYFFINKEFYNIARKSVRLDNQMLQLIDTFENDIGL